MQPKPYRRDKHKRKNTLDKLINKMFKQAKAQFGEAVKTYWFYIEELCPGCMRRPIDLMKYDGEDALSINAFIYRERGVLIGYFLCESCAKYIFDQAQRNPYKQTTLHTDIEMNLIAAYHRHLELLN